jgi:hypothetical protein
MSEGNVPASYVQVPPHTTQPSLRGVISKKKDNGEENKFPLSRTVWNYSMELFNGILILLSIINNLLFETIINFFLNYYIILLF